MTHDTDNANISNHPLCLGFDPDISDLHPFLLDQFRKNTVENFLLQWFSATFADIASVCHSVKIQSAFFEQFGAEGIQAMHKMIQTTKAQKKFVILDAKRGDISTTMSAYGKAAFETFNADALTILPWMGTDSLLALIPWLKQGKFVYIVWLSSNKSGRELQLFSGQNGASIAKNTFDLFYNLALRYNVIEQVGWVLGATDIPWHILDSLPKHSHSFLLPGIGAQGAQFNKATAQLFAQHPKSLFPISRGLIKPHPEYNIKSWEEYSQFVKKQFNKFLQELSAKSTRYI